MSQPSPLLNRLFSLEGKTVLITGASSGIGAAFAVAFAEAGAGARVGVHGRDRARVEQTCREVEAVGGQAVVLYADLGSVQACRDLIAEAHEKLGGAGYSHQQRRDQPPQADYRSH